VDGTCDLVPRVRPPPRWAPWWTGGFARRFAGINDTYGIFMDEPAAEVEPDLHLRLDGERLDRKVAALRAQDSQTRRLIDGVGLPTFRRWWAEESFVRRRTAARRAA
jgi:hypothetical protein